MGKKYIIALDQGTTSTRAIAFAADTLAPEHISRYELPQHYPQEGWVEHDAADIWRDAQRVLREAADYCTAQGGQAVALGITNQRETVVLWDKETGKPLHRAIVWQDRRTADRCAELERDGALELVRNKTGLVLDPYFSATKIAWLLRETNSMEQAEQGKVLAGTIDAYLVWMLTGGKVFASDVTNASRTQLLDLASMAWDDELLKLHGVPRACLPEVKDNAADYGVAEIGDLRIPIGGIAGDQQAAAIGQNCLEPGEAKSTYGTGCFVIVQGGAEPLIPGSGLLGTVGYRVGGRSAYAVEGSIFVAGAAVQWLRDKMGVIDNAAATAELAAQAPADAQVYLVPAFIGLGAPHWNPAARGTIVGMTLDTDRATLAHATLASVAYQSHDLLEAYRAEGLAPQAVRIDGGMAANDWFAQYLADVLDQEVSRPSHIETTAAGAAFLAGLQAGEYGSMAEMGKLRIEGRSFTPALAAEARAQRLKRWSRAVQAALAYAARDDE